ncbi:hypothetical protein Poly30_17770 [Planctomycetes bacterium Poly30]|uniref:Uncharacterized protein n=1 Tax=Saltatorellus ferox TaxID=2528018 RepID=A0A518EQA8_9BACT|nr:hypothetical protein Poly30_17770 [Planctomycetes bacterium Poly30]
MILGDATAPGRPDTTFATPPKELRRAYRSLVADVKLALLSEIGARSVFDHIARRARDPELAVVAKQLNEDGIWLVARVQELIRSMGGKPRRTSFRRRALARVLVHGVPITGPRPALRLIRHAEETVARWYAQYALFLVRIGDHERAQAFEDLRAIKIRHAQTIGAWVDNIGRGHGRSF